MKTRNLILIIFCISSFISCSSANMAWNTESKIKEVKIGMTKSEVINILGDNYLIDSSSKDKNGDLLETLAYKSNYQEEYKLKFVNDKLTEWNREIYSRINMDDGTIQINSQKKSD